MTVDYRYVVSDASTGNVLADLPLSNVTFSRVLTGVGAFSGQLPVDHAKATEANLIGDREISVIRNDGAVWNGPLVGIEAKRSDPNITLTAREASWYFGKRVLEANKSYTTQDVFDVVRDLYTYMTTKEDVTLGSIVAALPRFTTDSASAGATISCNFSGAARHSIGELLDFLAADPQTGFDYRMDYATGSTRSSVNRKLKLGYPTLGSTLTTTLTEKLLHDYERNCDWERAATRVHVLGSGYVKTLQNSGAVTAGNLLLESVLNLIDSSNHTHVDAAAKELRRLSQPPVRTFKVTYIPNASLPYGWCDLGDKLPLQISTPSILSINNDSRRVVEIDVTPADGIELVDLLLNLPLDQLGA